MNFVVKHSIQQFSHKIARNLPIVAKYIEILECVLYQITTKCLACLAYNIKVTVMHLKVRGVFRCKFFHDKSI